MLTRSLAEWFRISLTRLRPARRHRAVLRSELLETRVVPAVFVVNTTLDTVDANLGDGIAQDASGATSLRAAIMEANALAGNDTVQLPAGVFGLSIAPISTEDFATDGDLDITSNITVQGEAAATTILDANLLDRLFDVTTAGDLFLRNVTLRNGLADVGGAIRSFQGSVDIRDSVLSNNRATIRGGAIEISGVTGDVLGVYNTTLSNNLANGSSNPGTPTGNGIGGAISASGSMQVTLNQAVLSGNMAAGEGGALDSRSLSNLQIISSQFSGNRAASGGAIRLMSTPTSISGTSFNGDNAVSAGGAIRSHYSNITMSRATFDNVFLTNPNGVGSAGGVLHLTSTSNTANQTQIQYSEFRNSGGGDGGAIYNTFNTVAIYRSTFENASGGRLGGAVYNASGGRLWMNNTTITGSTGTLGGAIYHAGSSAILVNLTVSGNTSLGSQTAAGAAVQAAASSFFMVNNIVAGNTGTDVLGTITTQGGNVIGVTTLALATQTFVGMSDLAGTSSSPVNAPLSPLANNGGLVRTMAIGATSPARDRGVINSNVFSTDARDVTRSPFTRPDAGAYEYVNSTPIATSTTFYFDEDTVLTGQLPGFDADGDALTYIQVSPPNFSPGVFSMNENGTFTYTPPANMTGIVGAADYKVNDGRVDSAIVRVYFSANPVNDAPRFSQTTYAVDENAAAFALIGFWSVNDPDTNQFTFEIVSGNETGAFIFNPNNGAFGVLDPSQFNHEVRSSYDLVVRVTEAVGPNPLSTTATIRVNVNDLNEAPSLSSGSASVDENPANGQIVANLGATDPDNGHTLTYAITSGNTGGAFAVDAGGNLIVANPAAIDFETNPSFTLTITVSDNGAPSLSASGQWTVTVTNVEEGPTVAPQSLAIPEQTAVDSVVGQAVATRGEPFDALNFYLSGPGAGDVFSIDPFSGVIRLIAPLDYETASSYAMTLTVVESGVTQDTVQVPFTITVIDFNEAPVLLDGFVYVPENSPNGTIFGNVGATDVNPDDTLSYAITAGNVGGLFSIDSAGNLSVANSAALNYEARGRYDLTVTVTDNGQPALTTSATWSVQLQDVNELPVITGGPYSIAENASPGSLVGQVQATDEDTWAILTYVITGTTAPPGMFAIDSATGAITLIEPLDYETASGYSLTVTVFDGGNHDVQATHQVVINVTNANDAPQATGGSFSMREDAVPNPPVVRFDVQATDQDAGQSLTYAIVGGNTNGKFTINASTGEIVLAATLSYETQQVYNLQVRVTDNGNPALSTTVTVTANIIDVNESPFVSGGTYSAPENAPIGRPTGGATGSDFDFGQTLTYDIISGNTGNAFAINSATGAISVAGALDYETKSQYVLTVRVTDNGTPTLSGVGTVIINITNVNDAPTFAGGSFSVVENSPNSTTVGALTASDQDVGQSISYAIIAGNEAGKFSIHPTTGVISVVGHLNYEAVSSYALTVRVTDNAVPALSTDGTVNITVLDENDRPAISGGSVLLDENTGNGTIVTSLFPSDEDVGQILSFAITSGNIGGAFLVDSSGRLVVANSAALDYESVTTFSLEITVSDNGIPVKSMTNRWFVNLRNVNESPVISAQSFPVAENSASGTAVGTVVASDPDAGQTLTYAIIGGNADGKFAINPTTGAISVAGPLNYEVESSRMLTVRVTDSASSALSATAAVTISIADVNEAPVATGGSFSVDENSAVGTVIGAVTASDPDIGQTLSFTIVSGDQFGRLAISGSGVISVAGPISYEGFLPFSLIVRVSDNGIPSQSVDVPVSIAVNDLNEAPVIPDSSFSVAESAPLGFIIGWVSVNEPDLGQTKTFAITAGNEAGRFAIDSATGAISRLAPLDFEAVSSYSLTVTVTDNGTPSLSGTGQISITVTDANDYPVVTGASVQIAENSPVGTAIATVGATDQDAGQSLSFAITNGNQSGAFAIDAVTGQITLVGPLDYESESNYLLFVTVTDDGNPSRSTVGLVSVTVTNVNDTPTASAATFSLAENSPAGTAVGTVSASDQDSGQSLSYAITGGNTSGAFAINSTTGAITVANAAALNFESTPSFALQVTVTDNGGPVRSSSATITVNLTNVNETPTIGAQSFTIAENSPVGTAVGTVIAGDVDAGQSLTYSIVGGNTGGAFAINATTGAITVVAPAALNYEVIQSVALIIRVVDNGNPALSAQATVTVLLTNVNETPAITGGTFSLAENSPNGTAVGSVSGSDPDAGQTLTYSIVSGNTGGAFAINAATGAITVANVAALDYETTPVFNLVVRVTDSGNPALSATAAVTVTLTNVVEIQSVLLDVVPGDSTNTIRLNSSTFKVAVLSTSTFDARTINVNSVLFGKTGSENSVALKKGQRIYEYRDVNGDGRLDLVLTITTSATGLVAGDTLVKLTGQTTAGLALAGQSAVNVLRR